MHHTTASLTRPPAPLQFPNRMRPASRNDRALQPAVPRTAVSPRQAAAHHSHNRSLGAHGEALAAHYLEGQGCRVIDRNWRSRYGEIDLVLRDGQCLVAVEVKTRSGRGYGSPLEAITAQKSARLRRLLLEWTKTHGGRAPRLRVDAVGITLLPGSQPIIDHLKAIA